MKLLLLSIKRRKKEVRPVVLASFVSALFLAGILMFQTVTDDYTAEQNAETYGNWIIASDRDDISHPYLGRVGSIRNITSVVTFPTPEDEAAAFDDNPDTAASCSESDIDIGVLDDTVRTFAHFPLYEGRLPKKENEIAADLYALSALGLSYDLGQEITLPILVKKADENGPAEFEKKTFILTGTVYSFAVSWDAGSNLPELIVSSPEIFKCPVKDTRYFYELRISRKSVDTAEFFEELSTEYSDPSYSLSYNRNLYEKEAFGDRKNYRGIYIAAFAAALTAIAWLLISYTGKRKAHYLRLRSIGASEKRLRGIVFSECGILSGIPALAGILAAYMLTFLLCLILSKFLHVRNFFRFDPAEFLKETGLIITVILLSSAAAVLSVSGRLLYRGEKAYTARGISKLHRMAKRDRKPEKHLFSRIERLHPGQRITESVFMLLMSALLLFALFSVFKVLIDYIPYMKTWNDYSISVTDHWTVKSDLNMTIGIDLPSPYKGADADELNYLSHVKGIRKTEAATSDSYHLICWDGIGESTTMKAVQDHSMTGFAMMGLYDNAYFLAGNVDYMHYPNRRIPEKLMADCGAGNSFVNWESFENGDFALLFMQDTLQDFMAAEDPYVVLPEDPTLRSGDTVTILSPLQSGTVNEMPPVMDIPVEIVRYNPFGRSDAAYTLETSPGVFTMVISDRLFEKIADTDGKEIKANELKLYAGAHADYLATDKILSRFCASKSGYTFSSDAETKRLYRRENITRNIAVYGSLFIMVFLIFGILLKAFADLRMNAIRRELSNLRNLGLTRSKTKAGIISSELRKKIPILPGAFIGIFLRGLEILRDVIKNYDSFGFESYYSKLLHDYSDDRILYALEDFLYHSHLMLLLLSGIILYFAAVIFCTYISLKRIKTEENQ